MRFSKSSGNRAGLIESSILPFYPIWEKGFAKTFRADVLSFSSLTNGETGDKFLGGRNYGMQGAQQPASPRSRLFNYYSSNENAIYQITRTCIAREPRRSPPLLSSSSRRRGVGARPGPLAPPRGSMQKHQMLERQRRELFHFPAFERRKGGESSHRPPVIYPPPPSIDQLEISSRSSVGGRGGGRNAETVFLVRDRKRLRAKRKKERKNGAINCFRDKRLGRRGGRKRWLVRRGAFD